MTKINNRKKKIFDMLKEHRNGLSGEHIAQQMGVSSRTIRSDIKVLQNDLVKYNIQIIASPNKGYRFDNFEQLNNIEQDLFKDNINTQIKFSEQRENLILYRLLENTFLDSSITQNELADEFFISLSTLKNQLNIIKDSLKKYNLKIIQYKTKGIKIIGDESKLRFCIADILSLDISDKFQKKVLATLDMNLLNQIIEGILGQNQLKLADKSKDKLCIHIAIAIQRFKYNKIITYPSSIVSKIEVTFEYSVAKKIVDNILTKLNIDIDSSEVYYIAQCLLASKKLRDVNKSKDKIHIKRLVNNILKEIKAKLSMDFTSDEYLIEGLTLHLNIALTRIQFQMNIRNELLDTIKNDYPLAFQMGVIAGKIVEKYDNIKINENEIGYIALHFGAAISRNGIKENTQSKNIFVVCSSGLGIAVLLKAKIEEYFHNRLNVVKVLPSYEVTENLLDKVDYILSTVPLKEICSDKVIRINSMLKKEDIEKIEEIIFHKNVNIIQEVSDLFNEKNFYVDKNFKSKEECINFLAEKAMKDGLINEFTKKSIFDRENISSTSIGDLAAIPHPVYSEQGKSFISILVLNEPIVWGEFLVQVVFLLNIENKKSNLWEPIFLKLYKYIKEHNGIKSILKHRSYNIFLEEILEMF